MSVVTESYHWRLLWSNFSDSPVWGEGESKACVTDGKMCVECSQRMNYPVIPSSLLGKCFTSETSNEIIMSIL